MRIAAVQSSPILDDARRVCDVIVEHLRRAEEQGIDMLLFPEAFLLGHSYEPETIQARARAGTAAALPELCKSAADFSTTLVVGAFELRQGQVFNTAFVIQHGRITGQYSKAYPNEPGVTAGTDCPTFEKAGVRFGINICNDANHADACAPLVQQNAALILYPLNNMLRPETAERWRERSIANLVARARQTGCWVVSADVVGRLPRLESFGCTAIVSPDGRVVARVPEGEEGMVVHDIPMGRLEGASAG